MLPHFPHGDAPRAIDPGGQSRAGTAAGSDERSGRAGRIEMDPT
jgi:hypothetical protein